MFSKLKTEKNQLGIYWGKDAFSLVESEKDQPDKIAYVRFDAPVAGDPAQKIPEGRLFRDDLFFADRLLKKGG